VKFTFYGKSDIGYWREVNQDRYLAVETERGGLFVVCDGFGHTEGGQMAAETVVTTLERHFQEQTTPDTRAWLQRALSEANTAVYQKKVLNYNDTMLGTTCVVLVLQGETAFYTHSGDSRIYHKRRERLHQLTRDHSLVQELVDQGVITPTEAESHPQRNILSEALGIDPRPTLEFPPTPLTLQHGDRLLLCSDGLWGLVPAEQLRTGLERPSPQAAVEHLIATALENGGYDNVTAVVVFVEAG
jgi:protein phosphatase